MGNREYDLDLTIHTHFKLSICWAKRLQSFKQAILGCGHSSDATKVLAVCTNSIHRYIMFSAISWKFVLVYDNVVGVKDQMASFLFAVFDHA